MTAPGATGNGGQIYLTAYNGLTFDGSASLLTANAGTSSGNGGKIKIQTSINPIVIDSGSSGNVKLSAKASGDGDGGTVDILSYAGITANPSQIDVSAGTDGTGGWITLNAYYSTLTLNGNLNANGGTGNGKGGKIELQGAFIDLPAMSNTSITANGNGSGKGGKVEILSPYDTITIGSANGQMSIQARNTDTGDGGEIKVVGSNDVQISGGSLDVGAGNGGDGGKITAEATSGTLTLSGNLSAKGGGSGSIGSITITGYQVSLGTGTISTDAGSTGTYDGTEDSIVITSTGSDLTLNTGLTISSKAGSSSTNSNSGQIHLTSISNITINSGVTLNVDNLAGSNANAGRILVSAGSETNSGYVSIDGSLQASATGATSVGGGVTISYSDPTGLSPVSIGGSINADQPAAGLPRGFVVFSNAVTADVGADISGLVSSAKGMIYFEGRLGVNANLTGTGQVIGPISIDNVTNNMVDITIDIGTGSITVHELDATGTVSIKTQAINGNILSDGGPGVNAPTVNLNSGGNIGIAFGQRFLTNANTMSVKANSSSSGDVAITNSNSEDKSLELSNGSAASTTFDLITNNSLTISSVSAGKDSGGSSHAGNLLIKTTGGDEFNIKPSAAVNSYTGGILIQSDSYFTVLTVGEDASIIAAGGSYPGFLGLEMGFPLEPLGFYTGGLTYFQPQFGSDDPLINAIFGFTANSPTSTYFVGPAGMILYGLGAGNIIFEGGNTITGN